MISDLGAERPISVLRNVTVQDSPHALVRPRLAAAQRQASNPSTSATHVSPPSPSLPDRGFDAGFAAGYSEGMAAGRAAQLAESEAWLEETASAARHRAAAEGHADGMRRAEAQAEQAAMELRAQLNERADAAAAQYARRMEQLVERLAAQADELLAQAEEDLVAMSHEIVCRILGANAAAPAAIKTMVEQLMSLRSQQTLVEVHVHPDDLEALKLESTVALQPAWQWVADDSVRLGGVLLRSASGSLDARLEVQLEALDRTLLEVRTQRRQARGPSAVAIDKDRVA